MEKLFPPALYKDRNAIESIFGRIKDFRRVVTRYDKLTRNFLSADIPQMSPKFSSDDS